MRIAVPTHNGRVSPVFDTARTLLVADVEGGSELHRAEIDLDDLGPMERVRRLADSSVAVLICGAISIPMARLAAAHGVRVLPHIAGEIEEVLVAYYAGTLGDPRFLLPGCGRRLRRRGGRGGRGRGLRGGAGRWYPGM
jgi:predicted Fe-Mo cluster-binding NifX family protein